jgi:hypothetical protein
MAVLATRPRRGSFALAGLGRLVALAAVVVALLIGAAIGLHVWAPHASGQVASWVRHAGSWLTQPFQGLVSEHGDARVWVNWGIAAAVYLVGGLVIARLMRSAGWGRRL